MTKPILSFIILVISIGFAILYGLPEYNLVRQRQSDIVTLSAILDNSKEIETLIAETTTNLNNINEDISARFSVFLPETIDVIRFGNNIQHIGLMSGAVLGDIKVEGNSEYTQTATIKGNSISQSLVNTLSLGSKIDQAQGVTGDTPAKGLVVQKKYATTKATFSLTTTYDIFQKLLVNLEQSLGLINITSLTFSPVSSNSDPKIIKVSTKPLYQFVISIETYSLR